MQQPPIREIENVRDLLVVALAPELGEYLADRAEGPQPSVETRLQMLVAFVLDHITPERFELLAELHAKRPGEEKAASHPETGNSSNGDFQTLKILYPR